MKTKELIIGRSVILALSAYLLIAIHNYSIAQVRSNDNNAMNHWCRNHTKIVQHRFYNNCHEAYRMREKEEVKEKEEKNDSSDKKIE